MRTVHTFWQLAEEEKEIFWNIEKLGRLVAYPSEYYEDKMKYSPRSIWDMLEHKDLLQVEIGLESQVELHIAQEQYFNGKLYYGLNYMNSPLLSYRRGQLINGRLTQSNLCAEWDTLSQDKYIEIGKDTAFVEWGRKVFRLFRRHTPEWHRFRSYRATRRAKEAFLRGDFELVEY